MKKTTRIPVMAIENWYKERVHTMLKNFQINQPDMRNIDADDPHFLEGAWKGALPYLEVEYNTWIDAANPVDTCEKCGHMKFISKE